MNNTYIYKGKRQVMGTIVKGCISIAESETGDTSGQCPSPTSVYMNSGNFHQTTLNHFIHMNCITITIRKLHRKVLLLLGICSPACAAALQTRPKLNMKIKIMNEIKKLSTRSLPAQAIHQTLTRHIGVLALRAILWHQKEKDQGSFGTIQSKI